MFVLLLGCNFLMHLGCDAKLKKFLLITNKHNQKLYIDHKVILKLYNIEGSYCFILFRNQWVKCDLIKEVLLSFGFSTRKSVRKSNILFGY